MRRWIASMMVLGCAGLLGANPEPVEADTFSMAAGMERNGGVPCYDWGVLSPNIGAIKDGSDPACFDETFVMPLYWRQFFTAGTNRTVQVFGRAPSGTLMGCTLSVYNSNGELVSQNTKTFSATGTAFGSVSLTVNNVLSSSTSFVECSSIGATHLVKVNYTP